MVVNYYVGANEFIKRYRRSKYSFKIYRDEVKNEYYYFTLRSCIVAKIYNDGKIDIKLDSFYHRVKLAIERGYLVKLKFGGKNYEEVDC